MALNVGVDLAQSRDRTAIAAVSSYLAEVPEAPLEGATRRPKRVRQTSLVHLSKIAPGLSYPVQAEAIVEAVSDLAGEERPVLWVDATGVGRAVVDLLRGASPFSVKAVTLTSAMGTVYHGVAVSVPKLSWSARSRWCSRRAYFMPSRDSRSPTSSTGNFAASATSSQRPESPCTRARVRTMTS
jgi:hypothetical protein